MKNIFYLILLFPIIVFAQEVVFQQEQYPFPVTFYGVEPQLGFIGASSKYHHDFGDLNGDGDFEIIIGTSNANEILCENIGSASEAQYNLLTYQFVDPGEYSNVCPPAFVDIDNDNDLDLFTGFNNGFLVFFRNIGSPDTAIYDLETNDYLGVVLAGGCPSHDFIDIDNDGDYDYFAGSISSGFGEIICFKNEGTPDSANLVLITESFEEIDVEARSAPEFIDIDNDADYDLFVGCEDGTIWFYENIGTPEEYDFEYVTNSYFDIYTGEVSVPRFCDIDNDGDYDLFVANESAGNTQGFEGDIAFFENTGDEYNADFIFVTGNYLFMDMSFDSSPSVVDLDDDGFFEIVVGINEGPIILFENNGSVIEPELFFADSSFLDLEIQYSPTMCFCDLDSDDDLDMVVKRVMFNNQWIDLYINVGSSLHPNFQFQSNIAFIDDHSGGGVALCDIDGDDDLDLFFGDGQNRIEYWENVGDVYDPRFQLVSDNYLNQPYQMGDMNPCFCDLDHDGDYDLIMGYGYYDESGNHIIFWRNEGNQISANFVLEDTIFSSYDYAATKPALADIDGDGDDDMFVGEGGGAMLFFRNLEYNLVDGRQSMVDRSFTLYPNYPNPFNASTAISFQLLAFSKVNLTVYDVIGREVATLINGGMDAGNHEIIWDAGGVSSGVYLIRLDTQAGYSESQKVMLVK